MTKVSISVSYRGNSNKNGCVLFLRISTLIIVQYSVLSTSHITPCQSCQFKHHLDFSGKHSLTLKLTHRLFIHKYPLLF